MAWGPRAYSLQFHLEIEPDTVDNWKDIPAYKQALHDALGADGAERLSSDCAEQMNTFSNLAERVYINWLQTSANTKVA